MERLKEVYQYIEDHQDRYIHWLQELCRQPSVSAQNRGMEECAQLVSSYLQHICASPEQIATPGYPVIYGEINENQSRTLSFYNHYDVQPEDPIDQWTNEPFAAHIQDGRIWARGVADNKGSLLSRICAVDAYQQVHGKLPINVKFIIEGEEEIGSPNLGDFAEKYKEKIKADACIWENGYKNTDGSLQVRLGVKGMLYLELQVQGANTDMHSSNAAIIPNPAWRLVWALSTLKDENEKILIPGFYDGVQAPNESENQLLEDMVYQEHETLKQLGLNEFLLSLSGNALKEKLLFQPTCTICGMESGYTGDGSKTVLPSMAKAKVDFRLVGNQDPQDILQKVRQHLDNHGFEDIAITTYVAEHPAKTDIDADIVHTVVDNVASVYGVPPQVQRTGAGTGPMYVACQKFGIPAVGFGVGHVASNQHAPNENIFVNDFIQGIKFAALVMHEFAE
ncbi:M20/M25/M40 family metallo-hydrolase [Geomicrobium sp. JCM 19039]|uniref:M20/M25/M40 family metallo-hydrolase n=1 Tax=Geomicrobium sp. JCM 19039 TaxID=1460636 RepID=UPI0027D8F7F2|nr:M20/M25/M40 family metallo-hydrolase [Geomicrobium sp. JCM 19039]